MRTLPNLDLSSIEVWVWDDTGAAPSAFLYRRRDLYAPIEGPDNLVLSLQQDHIKLEYRDGERFELDVRLAVTHPARVTASSVGGERTREAIWAEGHLLLPDRRIEVDHPGIHVTHDGMPSRHEAMTHYCYGVSPSLEFHAVWRTLKGEPAAFVQGVVIRDGVSTTITTGERLVVNAVSSLPLDLRLDLETADGESLRITGVTLNVGDLQIWSEHHVRLALTEWKVEGETTWGNDAQMVKATRPRSDAWQSQPTLDLVDTEQPRPSLRLLP